MDSRLRNTCLTLSAAAVICMNVADTAQALTWTWAAGEQVPGFGPNYGTQNVPAAGNNPGARHGAVGWGRTDGTGWLFGGILSGTNNFSDLWRFDPVTGFWVWIKGPNLSNQQGSYGTTGVPAPGDNPSARRQCARWQDSTGNLYVFGGVGVDANGTNQYLSDTWRYDPGSGNWCHLSGPIVGNSAGVYGTKRVPDSANYPGGRALASVCIDSGGKVWLYGGQGYSEAGTFTMLTDMWQFDCLTATWTWYGGYKSGNSLATYGEQGVPDPNSWPGARHSSAAWCRNDGLFWLFGGTGRELAAPGLTMPTETNDLWSYDPVSDLWTWYSGNSDVPRYGTYGTKGIFSSSNNPGSRGAAAYWTGSDGRLWLFGGTTNPRVAVFYHATGYTPNLSDLWCYDPQTDMWAWMAGSKIHNQISLHGTKGVGNVETRPGARHSCAFWNGAADQFFLYGGFGSLNVNSNHTYRDLWRVDLNAVPPSAPECP